MKGVLGVTVEDLLRHSDILNVTFYGINMLGNIVMHNADLFKALSQRVSANRDFFTKVDLIIRQACGSETHLLWYTGDHKHPIDVYTMEAQRRTLLHGKSRLKPTDFHKKTVDPKTLTVTETVNFLEDVRLRDDHGLIILSLFSIFLIHRSFFFFFFFLFLSLFHFC
jgi:hypothetical protein